jgi:hypothetical protein
MALINRKHSEYANHAQDGGAHVGPNYTTAPIKALGVSPPRAPSQQFLLESITESR